MPALPPKGGSRSAADNHAANLILVAEIIAPHGVKGAVSAESYSDNPRRFSVGAKLHSADGRSFTVASCTQHKGRLLLTLEEAGDRNAAEALRGIRLYADDAPPLPEGSYYHYQLLGLEVRENGVSIGRLEDILSYSANDIYVVRENDGRELLLPAVKAVIRGISLPDGYMEVTVPDGLRD